MAESCHTEFSWSKVDVVLENEVVKLQLFVRDREDHLEMKSQDLTLRMMVVPTQRRPMLPKLRRSVDCNGGHDRGPGDHQSYKQWETGGGWWSTIAKDRVMLCLGFKFNSN